jgi:flagellar hook-associated protein 2
MGRITSNVGLITGIPITDTVDQLMKIAAQPRDLLTSRTQSLQQQQLAINTLVTRLVAVQFDLSKLKVSSLFTSKIATSSDATKLTAAVATGGAPVAGSYQFTPVRTAAAQQLVSQRFESKTKAFAAESFSFRTGGFVNKGIALDELNGGLGVRRGQLRITDKGGDSAVIDLRYAVSVDDVLNAINSSTDINVTADVVGDTIRLTDNTGQAGTLTVQEVNNGHAAADLGIGSISLVGGTTSGTGTDVFTLHAGTRLSFLNDGTGVRITDNATDDEDLVITLVDGTTAEVDLSGATTVGDVLEAINDHEDLTGKITAAISSDGNRLELTDLTSGGGTFSVSNGALGSAADDLGLTTTAAGSVIAGERLVSGLTGTLLASLNGGKGVTTLGTLDITNRDGVLSPIDLSGAETLSDVIDLINAGATNVTAALNADRSGIVLTDTSGGSTSNFIVADSGGSTVATDLGITLDTSGTSVNSGSLDRRTLSAGTLLSRVNGGRGITTLGDISITGTTGLKQTLDLNKVGAEVKTIGDVIDAINASLVGVTASINATGDGILIVDTAAGPGNITILDSSGTLAADLGIAGTSKEVDVEATPTQVIDGTTTGLVDIEAGNTLEDVVTKINDLKKGVTAAIINDGQGFRLSLTVDKSGAANELLLQLQGSTFQFQEISRAQDAILQFGDAQSASGGILVTSANNTFNQVVAGLNLTVAGASSTPVTITVSEDDAPLVTAAKDFVNSYNALREELDELTDFNAEDLTTGLLFATNEALRVDSELGRAITDRYFGLGAFQTLKQIGISVGEDGQLTLDEAKLKAALADDPSGLENFFTNKDLGLVKKFDAVIERLSGAENGLLGNRYDALQATVDSNELRIERFNESLDRQRELLLLQFFQLEQVIANLQQSLSALNSLQPIEPLSIQRNR